MKDGLCLCSWRVPRDMPLSDSYVITARSVPAGVADPAVISVKVVKPRSRLEVSRVGHAEVEVRWSPGAVPPQPSGCPAWKLSIDVAPVLEPGETDDVIGDVFVQAALNGLQACSLAPPRIG